MVPMLPMVFKEWMQGLSVKGEGLSTRMAEELGEAVRRLENLAEQNRQLGEQAGRGAALEERAKLARELHDTVNQQLFALAMQIAAVSRKIENLGGDAASLAPELRQLETLAQQAHTETRALIGQLRPTAIERHGLGLALTEYIEGIRLHEPWQLQAVIDPSILIGGAAGTHLFRIAQEALHNASKHAQARQVWVTLTRQNDEVTLQIRDDGKGFDVKHDLRPTSVGLLGMQERVKELGGEWRIQSSPGQGTAITVIVPKAGEA